MNKVKLKNDYENACNAYLEAFCEKHDYIYEGLDMWVSKNAGTIANCGDGYFDMETIRTDIDEEAQEDELFKWNDYCMDASDFKLPIPNFHSWLHGCPRLNHSELDELRKSKRKLDMMKDEFEKMCKDASENLVFGNKLV